MNDVTGHEFTPVHVDSFSRLRKGLVFPRSRFFVARAHPGKLRRARVFCANPKKRVRPLRQGAHTAGEKAGTREQRCAPERPSSAPGPSLIRGTPRTPAPAQGSVPCGRGDFVALGHVLESSGRFTPEPPNPPWADPRPDLSADHARWLVLLELAYRRDAADPAGVFGALNGIRCCGARIVASGGAKPAWRLTRGEMTAAEWQAIRVKWLLPHLAVLQELLGTPASAIRIRRDAGTPSAPAALREAAIQP